MLAVERGKIRLHSTPRRIALDPRRLRARSRSAGQVCQKPGPRSTRSPLTTPAPMSSGSVVKAHQSLRRSLLARAPPASTWKPAVAVPHRNPRGNACRADAAGARATVSRRTAVATRQTRWREPNNQARLTPCRVYRWDDECGRSALDGSVGWTGLETPGVRDAEAVG